MQPFSFTDHQQTILKTIPCHELNDLAAASSGDRKILADYCGSTVRVFVPKLGATRSPIATLNQPWT